MVKKFILGGLAVFSLSTVIIRSVYASGLQGGGVAALVASEPFDYLLILAGGLTLVVLRRLMSRKRDSKG